MNSILQMLISNMVTDTVLIRLEDCVKHCNNPIIFSIGQLAIVNLMGMLVFDDYETIHNYLIRSRRRF